MSMHYNTSLKKKLCEDICFNHVSTIKTAEKFNVPLKTLEKWITSFNKDNHCFDPKIQFINVFISSNKFDEVSYHDLSTQELKNILIKKDIL